jgi:hypothetical protein
MQMVTHRIETHTARDLIRLASTCPPQPIIEGLWNVGDVLLIHGPEESFKSIFIIQLGESIATGTPFLRNWPVPASRTVGVIETEIHESQLGIRLERMFPAVAPERMRFLAAKGMKTWRRLPSLPQKFAYIQQWITQEDIEVQLIDTANDFFRQDNNPSDETIVGGFFDQIRNLEIKASGLVRHDRKRRQEADSFGDSNESIRGSAEWKEDPELIISLKRKDRRTNEVDFEVGKFRYGSKPDPLSLWFDATSMRLIPLNPIIAVLEAGPLPRHEILTRCRASFALGDRKVDEFLQEYRQFLIETQQGHNKVFQIDQGRAEQADWYRFLQLPGGAR